MKIDKISFTRIVGVHKHRLDAPCFGYGCGEAWCHGTTKIKYVVDTNTWKCTGESITGLVLVDPLEWERHCTEVAERVKQKLAIVGESW